MNIKQGAVDHTQISGVSVDDHHAQAHAADHSGGAGDEVRAENLATAGAAGTFLGSNGDGSVSMQTLAMGDLPAGVCRFVTGTYTGDGTTNQNITGLGGVPFYVWLVIRSTTELNSQQSFETFESMRDDNAAGMSFRSGVHIGIDMIITFDSDGFSVADDGPLAPDGDPNKDAREYNFWALIR